MNMTQPIKVQSAHASAKPYINTPDGKSPDCNRQHKFDDFVPPQKLAGKKELHAKRIGATWDVLRALVKLKQVEKPVKGLERRLSRKKSKVDRKNGVDRERLLG